MCPCGWLGVVVCASNPSTLETEGGGSQDQLEPELYVVENTDVFAGLMTPAFNLITQEEETGKTL